jgi:transcriptional regulator with GAF, ATPase, and Fis domain
LFTAVSIYLAKEELNLMHEKLRMQLIEINNYKKQLNNEIFLLDDETENTINHPEIIGNSPAIRNIFQLVEKVAPVNSTVLILGETGTGKELVAKAIHNKSQRKNKVMVKVNCAALPPNLIESELFGHERGSFTGATDRRIGKFEQADGGTIFLDEVGEMPLDLQVKLLRALQEREIERIGGKSTIKIDVRIIAATNRDLEKEMAEGRFRRDLYYRLNIFPITLPSLKERRQDIPLLASHFIKRFSKQTNKTINSISNSAVEEMTLYDWPGNIRELEHLIERSILLTKGNIINNIPLPLPKQNLPCESRLTDKELIITMDDNERKHINMVLKHCKGKVGGYQGAAKLLGIPASTLFSKMKKLGIKRDFI